MTDQGHMELDYIKPIDGSSVADYMGRQNFTWSLHIAVCLNACPRFSELLFVHEYVFMVFSLT